MIISSDLSAKKGNDLIEREPEMNTSVDTVPSNHDLHEIRNQMVAGESKNCRLGGLGLVESREGDGPEGLYRKSSRSRARERRFGRG